MIPVRRPPRVALIAAMQWAHKQMKMHPDYGGQLATLLDELTWHIERRESALAELRNREATHAAVIPIRTVRALLTEGER